MRLQTEREEEEEDEKGEDDDMGLEDKNKAKAESGIAGVVKRIYEEQGLKGFWRGNSAFIFHFYSPN